MKLDWFNARMAFNERDAEKLLSIFESKFEVQISRQLNCKFIPHGWEEIVVYVGNKGTSYKIDKSGWSTWLWRATVLGLDNSYNNEVIIYGFDK